MVRCDHNMRLTENDENSDSSTLSMQTVKFAEIAKEGGQDMENVD